MRSQKIHAAIAQGNTRFEICQIVAKGVRVTHKHGTRLEDSINSVMGMLKTATPLVDIVPAAPKL